MKRLLILLAVVLVLFSSCDTGRTLTSATGTIYELLVVGNESSVTAAVTEVMGADMPCLPQMEPYFNVNTVRREQFDDILKPTRNVLFADINAERYTQTKIAFKTDVYSHPQAMCIIQAPSVEAFDSLWTVRSSAIRNWFVDQEIKRQCEFNKTFCNFDARELIQRNFQADMVVPADYMVILDTVAQGLHFMWMCNDKGSMRRDLVVYSYPYTDAATFTGDYQLGKRDEVMRKFVSGSMQGSYVGTEYKHIPPQYAAKNINGAYAGELRGLWKMLGGVAMGGPFVSITRLDELQQRVVTAETFIYAAGQKKRNALRQAEAVLYSLRLSGEVNNIDEVEIQVKE